MSYDIKKHADTLELNVVLGYLAQEAITKDAKQLALELIPQNDEIKVAQLLSETESAYLLISKFSAPSLTNVKNVSSILTRARLSASLSASELLQVADVLRCVRTMKTWRNNSGTGIETNIDYLFNNLYPNKFLEDKINSCIKSSDEIYDNASSLLAELRRKIKSKSLKIKDDLEKIVRGQMSKYLQDAIITQRDGRFVVPVRAEHKGEIKGIVHDTSSSGSTFFIEPMSVVETNNEIRVLKIKEQDEIARILYELSLLCADFSDNIIASYDSLIKLDLIFAKAKLAYKTASIVPKINTRGYVYLKKARHPLINKRVVVPITMTLGGEYDSLIITGPNTGGKTVALKTVGLLCLMAMCGLMIPADDNSEIAVFNKIFADIGDEQSIEQSLSTFSSHIVNIISIVNECDDNSLVLFDELCAGTDPIEGAALAKAILMRMSACGVKSVATTHYPELKAYAIDTDRVENASCEFDIATLKPTYNLIIGQPGRSNAFAISKRLGLSEDIINLAANQVTDDDIRFERVVASLEKARQQTEREKMKISKLRAEITADKRYIEEQKNSLRAQREKLIEQSREKATAIIENARYKSSLLLNELEGMKKTLNAQNAANQLYKAKSDYKKTILELENEANPVFCNTPIGEKLSKTPHINDIVVVGSINRDATVVGVDENGKRAYVMSGSMKMWIPFDDLRVKKSQNTTEIKKPKKITGITSRADRTISSEIDLRGMASDEAILELDRYIDNAVLSGVGSITIIHGKGTGTLRKCIQAHLRSHKNIKTHRIGLFGEGENGVTIAEIKD